MSTATAHPVGTPPSSVLRAAGTTVEVHDGGPDDVLVIVTAELETTEASDVDPGASAVLLCAAVSQARARRTRRLRTVLDASSPACWEHLQALRSRVGDDVASITLRRAGSSVLVTLDLLPPAAPPRSRTRRTRPPRAGHSPVGRPPSGPQPRPADPHPRRRTS